MLVKTCPFKIISIAKSINNVFQLLHVVSGVGRAGLMKNAIELHYVVCISVYDVWTPGRVANSYGGS